jgi:hypothetical protein
LLSFEAPIYEDTDSSGLRPQIQVA